MDGWAESGLMANTDLGGKRMVHALEGVGVAWLMINVALFVAMKRGDAMDLSQRTIDRFRRAIGGLSSLPTTGAADARSTTMGGSAKGGWAWDDNRSGLLAAAKRTGKS